MAIKMLIAKNLLLLASMLFFSAGCWGIGSKFLDEKLHAMRILVGMAIFIFVAGVLNLFALAYLPVLVIPLVYGVLITTRSLVRYFRDRHVDRVPRKDYWIIAGFLLLIWALCAVSVSFPEAYNFHDDYQKYFIQPVKMLATGSFYGSSLSTAGKEILGAQSALQAVFIGLNGISSINAFDAVFCLLLAAFLLMDFGRERRQLLNSSLCAFLLVVIHPQYVNVSSIYSFVCFAIGVVIVHQRMLEGGPTTLTLPYAMAIGAFYASMIALKTTYVFLPLAHFPFVVISFLCVGYRFASVLRWSLTASICGFVAILPWSIRTIYLFANAPGSDRLIIPVAPDWGNMLLLFSSDKVVYGGAPLIYLSLLAGGFTLLLFGLATLKNRPTASDYSALTALLSALLVLVYFVAFVGNELHTFGTTLRYSAPFLIALIPISLLILGQKPLPESDYPAWTNRSYRILSILLPICLSSLWLPTKFGFLKQSFRCGSALAFSQVACDQHYIDYNRYVLNGAAKGRIKKLQELVPEGATIIAWLNYAHLLDFQRNKIIEVDTAGLSNPWAVMPDASYIMVDINGFATRRKSQLVKMLSRPGLYDVQIWKDTLDFIKYLETKVPVEAVLAKEQDIVVYKIKVAEDRNFKTGSS